MSKNQIVIVTQRFDPHTDNVIQALQEMGYEAIRLNTNDIPLDTLMSLCNNSSTGRWGGSIRILLNGRIIDIDTIRSVWWRRPGEFCLPITLSQQEHEFAKGEIDHALRGLWASLDCYWISYPEYIRQASWKISQLQRASQLGFEVPRTLVTTDKEDARAFYDECDGQVVFKVMTDPLLAAPERYIASHAAYTTTQSKYD